MNLGVLRARCETRFRDPDNTVVTDTTWNQHINEAYEEFCRETKWPIIVTSANLVFGIGVRSVAAPVNALEGGLKDIFDSTNDRLLHEIPADLPDRQRRFMEQNNSKPLWYRVVGNKIYVIPPPAVSTTIQVFYYTTLTQLAADGDIPTIPVRYHEALVAGALVKAHADDENYEQAKHYREEYERLRDLASRDLFEQPAVSIDARAEAR